MIFRFGIESSSFISQVRLPFSYQSKEEQPLKRGMKSLFYTNRITASSYYIRAQKHSSLSARFETSSRSLNYLGRDRFQNLRENGSLSPILCMHYTGLFNPLLCPHKLKQHERRSRRKTRVVSRALAHPFVRAQQSVRICAFCAFAAHSYARCSALFLALSGIFVLEVRMLGKV